MCDFFSFYLLVVILSIPEIYTRVSTYSHCGLSGKSCVEIHKCPYFNQLLKASPIPRPANVIKIIRQHQCGFEKNSPKVCCTEEITKETQSKTMPKENNSNVTCGRISTSSRITNGNHTGLLEFPWMALLVYYTKNGIQPKCAGTLINDQYVLTAAHCIDENLNLAGVRLGEHNINTERDCNSFTGACNPPVQDFNIGKIIIHPEYEKGSYHNDIALIKLATRADTTLENVQPICLPIGDMAKSFAGNQYAIVTGWGVTESGHRSAELLKVSLPVITGEECRQISKRYQTVINKQICAGGVFGRDSCGGDSGGPLKYVVDTREGSRYVQYGIVSYGPTYCGSRGQPGVYTNVVNYVPWIIDNIKSSLIYLIYLFFYCSGIQSMGREKLPWGRKVNEKIVENVKFH